MQNTLKMATNTFLIAFSKTWASHWAQLGDHLAAAVGIAEKGGLWLRRGPFLDLPAGSWDVIIRTWNNRPPAPEVTLSLATQCVVTLSQHKGQNSTGAKRSSPWVAKPPQRL